MIIEYLSFHENYIFFSALLRSSFSIPLNPGQPGGEWSSDEINIVRDKVKLKKKNDLYIFEKFVNQKIGNSYDKMF